MHLVDDDELARHVFFSYFDGLQMMMSRQSLSLFVFFFCVIEDDDEPTRLVVIIFFGYIEAKDHNELAKFIVVFFCCWTSRQHMSS